MSPEAARKYAPKTAPGSLVVLDSTCVRDEITTPGRVARLPITQAAVDLGNKVVANAVALGVVNALAGIVSHENLVKAVVARVPRKYAELNERALTVGAELATAAAQSAGAPATAS
jgi:2-oxoglutarate ferredoxin oxidoreductase subunit gamma